MTMQDQDDRPLVVPPDAAELQAAFEDAASKDPAEAIQRRKRREHKARRKKVSNARSALLAVVALSALSALLYVLIGILGQHTSAFFSAGVYFFLMALYVGLYAWARRQPYPALLTGLLIYAVIFLLDVGYAIWAMQVPGVTGTLMRILILFFLVRGYLAARSLRTAVNV